MAIRFKVNLSDQGAVGMDKLISKLKKHFKPDEEITVYAGTARKPFSRRQQCYMHVVIEAIADYSGETHEKVHDAYKKLFNPEFNALALVLGQDPLMGGTTTAFDSKELTEYIEKIRAHANEFFGLNIPSPDEIPDEVYVEMMQKGLIR